MDGKSEAAMEDAGGADVVVVVVGDNQGLDLADVPPVMSQSQLGLSAADTGVKEQPGIGGFHVDAVAV